MAAVEGRRSQCLTASVCRTRARLSVRARDEQGIALIISLMATTLMMALGIALILTTMTEGKIANNYLDGTEALYAADAAVERVMQDILTVPDWNNILSGATTSAFIDGGKADPKTLSDNRTLRLDQATNLVSCGKVTTCGEADLNAITDDRPWGANNPRWQLYAYGPMDQMLPTVTINSSMYVVVWIADDPSESDNNPVIDGGTKSGCTVGDTSEACVNKGKGVIAMLAHAYGPNGVHRAIEVTLARTDTTEMERGYTGQRGQDEQNRRARKAAVQTPGKALTRTVLTTGA